MNKELKKKALTQLLKQEYSDKIKNLVDKELKSISNNLLESSSYEELMESLSLLNILAFREVQRSIKLIDRFIERLQGLGSDLKEDWNRDSLVVKSLEILNYIRYGDVKKSLKLLLKYSLSDNKRISDKVKETLENISQFNINVLDEAKLGVHFFIIEELEKLTPNDKVTYSSAICIICSEMLSCQKKATSSTYESMTFHTGSIHDSQGFRDIRKKSIAILQKTYDLISNSPVNNKIEKNLEIISAMDKSCWQNSQLKEDAEYYKLFNLVVENGKEVVKFYTSKIEDKQYKILLKMDSNLARLHHKSYGVNEGNTKNEKTVEKSRELEKIIENFRDELNKDPEFVIYSGIMGYKSIFTSYYGHKEEDYKDEMSLIQATIEKYAKSVTQDNLDQWVNRIFSIIRESDESDQVFRILSLLKSLVKINPAFGFKILADKKEEVSALYDQNSRNEVTLNILSGLVEVNNPEIKKLIKQYIKDGQYIKECALSLGYNRDEIDISLLEEVLEKIKSDSKDKEAKSATLKSVIRSIETHIRSFDKNISKEIKDFSLKIIKELTLNKIGQSSDNIFSGSLIVKLSEEVKSKKESKVILDNLLLAKIDYGSEEVLLRIAKKYPKEVMDFFEERLEMAKSNRDYEAIPYEFYNKDLRSELANNIELLFAMVRRQFDIDKELFEYRAAKIFQAVFKDFEESFEKELVKLINIKNTKDFEFVIRILRSYTTLNDHKNRQRLHNVCKQIINSPLYDGKDNSYYEISIILTSSGPVWGKYGQAENIEKKVEEVASWKNDSSDKVREFYDRFSREELENARKEIARADEEEELRKYEFEN